MPSEVHTKGGWELKVGNLKKCAAWFKKHPTDLHNCLGWMGLDRGVVFVCVCACWGLDELAGMNGGLDEWGWDLRWCQQRDALIKLRNDNPGMRIRTPDQLGVRSKLVRTRSWLVWLTRNIK